MTRQIYLIRHGETDWNRERRFQGQTDVPLNAEGRRQAAELAASLAPALPFDRLVSSDLLRAKETAEIVGGAGAPPVIPDEGFREMNFGEWEGLSVEAIRRRWPAELAAWFAEGVLDIPGGENQDRLMARAWKRFCYWADKTDYQKMALVCHGGVCGVLVCALLGKPALEMSRYMPANTGMTLVHVEGQGDYRVIRRAKSIRDS